MAYVSDVGIVEVSGEYASSTYNTIGYRPAMWLVKEEQRDIYGPEKASYSKISEAVSGDLVLFGHYEQNGDETEKEPIEWIVLARKEDKILLLSRYILEKMQFGNTPYWENSEIREWLNNEFYTEAFDSGEKVNIQPIITSDKTSDLIFSLTAEEARGLFKTDEERIANITQYLCAKGFNNYNGRGVWWTRSVGRTVSSKTVVTVEEDGNVLSVGSPSVPIEGDSYNDIGIRTVMCVNLSGAETDALNMSIFGYDSNHDLDNEPKPSSGKNNSSSKKCPNCGGSGIVKFYYGGSDLEAYFSGHDSYTLGECPMCDGTGK